MLIFKESLPMNTDVGIIELPYKTAEEARKSILHLETQYGKACMWYDVYDYTERENNEFVLVTIGTGHDWGDALKREEYIGSLVVAEGVFVWHYFLVDKAEFEERFKKQKQQE